MKKQTILKFTAVSVLSLFLCGCSGAASAAYKGEAASDYEYATYAAVPEQESKDEALYVKAVEEEKFMHYTYAKELFSQIMDYKDAKARYDNLLKILTPYNGSYYIESESGSSYTITINDGVGALSWDKMSENVHTMNLYGMYFRDVSDEVCMVFDVNLGREDWNYAATQDIYILELDESGNVNIHGIDSNKEHIWDGSGIKAE